jgi:hypothetical protein
LLHLLGIIFSMPGTRRQAGESQAMEQIIDTAQGVLDPEFFSENALGFFGPQGADAVSLGGFGQETRFERHLFRGRQVWRSTGLSLGSDGFGAMIPVRIHPALHERSAASQGPCDRRGVVTFESQQNGSIAVSLLGIPLPAALLTQLRQVFWMVEFDVHPTVPPVSLRVCQMLGAGATLF